MTLLDLAIARIGTAEARATARAELDELRAAVAPAPVQPARATVYATPWLGRVQLKLFVGSVAMRALEVPEADWHWLRAMFVAGGFDVVEDFLDHLLTPVAVPCANDDEDETA